MPASQAMNACAVNHNQERQEQMNKQDILQVWQLTKAGFSPGEIGELRRIGKTLNRWWEHECGTGDNKVNRAIVRHADGKPFMRCQYWQGKVWQDVETPIRDAEKSALAKLESILANHPGVKWEQGGLYVKLVPADKTASEIYL